MIYFDNAATTRIKPDEVYEAFYSYMKDVGVSPGRGSYQLGISASRMLYQTRCCVGSFFGMSKQEKVVFTKNSTEAINMLLNGILKKGDHVIISCFEHNAVLRPLEKLRQDGIVEYSVVNIDDLSLKPEELYIKYAKSNTRMIAFTLASNLTGRILFNPQLLKCFKSKGILTFVDASQGGGKINISMQDDGIDYLAFTGHKDLFALPGVGGLCIESKELPRPLIQGGTGIHGEEYVNPNIFPEGYEAGTLNMPAIWSLKTSIEYISKHRVYIKSIETELLKKLLRELEAIKRVVIYDKDVQRVPTLCFNIIGISSDKVVAFLDSKSICVRGGIHCAVLAHEALHTIRYGAVRVSINYQNTVEEIYSFCNAIKELCE